MTFAVNMSLPVQLLTVSSKKPLMREVKTNISGKISDTRRMTSQFVCGRFGKFISLSEGTSSAPYSLAMFCGIGFG